MIRYLKLMKSNLTFIFVLFFSLHLFAEEIFPSFQTWVDAGNDFQIYHGVNKYQNTHYLQLYYKNLDSYNAEILAAKVKNAKMELIVRNRQLAPTRNYPENFCDYYLITIEKDGNATSEKITDTLNFDGFYCFEAKVNDNKVNFRDRPGLTGIVKGQYQENTTVEFMGKLAEYTKIGGDSDYWYCFNFNGTEKWIFGRWLTFPKLFQLDSELFTIPQTFTKEELINVSSEKSIESLPFENTTNSVNWIDSYKTGDSELQIIHGSKIICKIIKNKEVISIIENPGNSLYSPVTKCLYYINRRTQSLHAVSVETGRNVSLVDKTLKHQPDEVYLRESMMIFDLNKTKDKLFYFGEIWEYDGPTTVLESIDLKTMEHKKINLSSLRSDFPNCNICNFGIIDSNNFFIMVYDYHGNGTAIVAWYRIINETPVLMDSIKFSGLYKDECSFFSAGNKIIFNISGIENANYVLNTEMNAIKKEKFEAGSIYNTFVYDGVEYFAAVYAEKEYADSYTVTIYGKDTLKEVQKKVFKPLNHLWGISVIGICDGKILVEDTICK